MLHEPGKDIPSVSAETRTGESHRIKATTSDAAFDKATLQAD